MFHIRCLMLIIMGDSVLFYKAYFFRFVMGIPQIKFL